MADTPVRNPQEEADFEEEDDNVVMSQPLVKEVKEEGNPSPDQLEDTMPHPTCSYPYLQRPSTTSFNDSRLISTYSTCSSLLQQVPLHVTHIQSLVAANIPLHHLNHLHLVAASLA